MTEFNVILTGTTIYLAITGLLMNWLGPRDSASRQHVYAFLAITIFVLGMLPQLGLTVVTPGIYICLGMMLLALQLSAYFSGTKANSSRLYAVLLILAAILTTTLTHPYLFEASFGRFILAAGLWLLIQQFEQVTHISHNSRSRVEQSFLWLWIISAVGSLMSSQINLMPDIFFILMLLAHVEKNWGRGRVISPFISLYGILLFWYMHLINANYKGGWENGSLLYLLMGLSLALLLISFRRTSLSKRFFYILLSQEILIISLQLDSLFEPTGELFLLMRLLLFISLNGLFVMIESKETTGITFELMDGLFNERPRFTTAVMIVSLLFVIYPVIYFSGEAALSLIMLGAVILGGCYHVFLILRSSFKQTNRSYRILRPSLSIWSTVVFIILWSTVTLLESAG